MRYFSALIFFILLNYSFELQGQVKDSDLERFRGIFNERIKADNPGLEKEIDKFLSASLRSGSAGTTFSDKFALFMYDSSVNRVTPEKIRFFPGRRNRVIFIVLRDHSDGELYSLYLEYVYSGAGDLYSLGDIFFSMAFSERVDAVRSFFAGE